MDKKSLIILVLLLAIVVFVIVVINYAGGNHNNNGNTNTNNSPDNSINQTNEQIIICIGKKAKLVVSPTCGYCSRQKQDLEEFYEDYDDYVEVVDISENPEIIEEYRISGVPSWVINEEVYSGYQPISKIKELTGC